MKSVKYGVSPECGDACDLLKDDAGVVLPGCAAAIAYRATFGQRVNANTHSPIGFANGTRARIVHHRLRPARCRMPATGMPTRMRSKRGMAAAIKSASS